MTEISGIIPAVNDFKQFRKFLESEYGTCVIMHCTIFDLETMFKELKSHGKQALIHCDLIKGLSADEYGAEYLCGKLHPAGLISIKPSVISACRKLSVTAVQRAFLIDSSALEKSILTRENKPTCQLAPLRPVGFKRKAQAPLWRAIKRWRNTETVRR